MIEENNNTFENKVEIFRTTICKNIDTYYKESKFKVSESFKTVIYDGMIAASLEGKSSIVIRDSDLFEYDLFSIDYMREANIYGLTWRTSCVGVTFITITFDNAK